MADPKWDDTTLPAPPSQDPAAQSPDAPTWDNTQSMEEKYGGLGGEAKAAALGAANTLSLGAIPLALSKTGLVSAQTQKGLADTNPISSGAGEAGGLVASHFYGAGEAEDAINAAKVAVKAAAKTGNALEIAKATEAYSAIKNTMGAGDLLNPVKAISKIGGKVAQEIEPGVLSTTAGAATEGALFGAGNTVNEAAKDETHLGDPDEVAESLLHNVGYGGLLGGGLGAVIGTGEKLVSKIPEAINSTQTTLQKATRAVDQILGDVPRETAPVVAPEAVAGIKPTSIQDMQARVAKAIAGGETIEMPEKTALTDAASRVELDNPLHPLQVNALDDQASNNTYRIAKEMPGEQGDTIRGYEALQKNELVDKTDQAIQDISPGHEPTANAVKGGQQAIDAFSSKYQETQDALKPALNSIKDIETENPGAHTEGVISAFSDALPGVARMFDTTGNEADLKLNPYSTSWGIEKSTYNAVKQATEALKEPADIEHLMNIRMGLEQNIDLSAGGKAAGQIKALKASMMEYIQKEIEKVEPFIKEAGSGEDLHIRSVLKNWAINEQQREVIENAFGASVGSPEWGQISKVKPETILDNIFRNTATVRAAKNILGPEKFSEILANHLSEQRALATKDKVFSSNKFWRYLRGNQDALNEAFSDNPAARQKIKDLNTIMRILPDNVSINPSGTAKTLMGSLSASPLKLLDNLKEYGAEKFQRIQATDELNKQLAGTAAKETKISALQAIKEKLGNQISSGVKSIFKAGESGAGFLGSKLAPEDRIKDHMKTAENLNSLNNNPQLMLQKMTDATRDLYPAAPNATSSVQSLAVKTTQFLSSKLPHDPTSSPLSKPMTPSNSEMAKFERYKQTVDDPLSVFQHIKNGTLSNEAIETLQTVYPKMYGQMQQKVFSQISSMKDPSKIPYQTKLMLSRFMGQPMTNSLQQPSIAASQLVYAQPTSQDAANQKMMKPNAGGMGKITVADRTGLRPNDEA